MPAKPGITTPELVGEIIHEGGEADNAVAEDEGPIFAAAEGTTCTFYQDISRAGAGLVTIF